MWYLMRPAFDLEQALDVSNRLTLAELGWAHRFMNERQRAIAKENARQASQQRAKRR